MYKNQCPIMTMYKSSYNKDFSLHIMADKFLEQKLYEIT